MPEHFPVSIQPDMHATADDLAALRNGQTIELIPQCYPLDRQPLDWWGDGITTTQGEIYVVTPEPADVRGIPELLHDLVYPTFHDGVADYTIALCKRRGIASTSELSGKYTEQFDEFFGIPGTELYGQMGYHHDATIVYGQSTMLYDYTRTTIPLGHNSRFRIQMDGEHAQIDVFQTGIEDGISHTTFICKPDGTITFPEFVRDASGIVTDIQIHTFTQEQVREVEHLEEYSHALLLHFLLQEIKNSMHTVAAHLENTDYQTDTS